MVAEEDGDVDMSHEEDTKGRLARAQSRRWSKNSCLSQNVDLGTEHHSHFTDKKTKSLRHNVTRGENSQ
jgi:hypothetical protein